MTQRTLVLLKPDAVRRAQVGEIVRRIEAKGYTLVALNLHWKKKIMGGLMFSMGMWWVSASICKDVQLTVLVYWLSVSCD